MILENLLKKFDLSSGCHFPGLLESLHILQHLIDEWIKHHMLWDGLMCAEDVDEVLQCHVCCCLIYLFISSLIFVVFN